MYKQVEKSKENKSRAVANSVTQKKSNGKQGFGFVDNRGVGIQSTVQQMKDTTVQLSKWQVNQYDGSWELVEGDGTKGPPQVQLSQNDQGRIWDDVYGQWVDDAMEEEDQLPINHYKQSHFAVRTDKQKGKPMFVLGEFFDGNHGTKALTNSQINTKKYREPQVQYNSGSGGTGQDEIVSTATTRDFVKTLNPQDAYKATNKLSSERMPTMALMWGTNDVNRPISGHPGALSKKQSDMRLGLTGEHGTKDVDRANAVNKELTSGSSLDQKLANAVLRAQIESTQHFMKPYGEMDNIDVSKATEPAYHPRFGQIITIDPNTKVGTKFQPNYSNAMKYMHNERELLKDKIRDSLTPNNLDELFDKKEKHNNQIGSMAYQLDKNKTLEEYNDENKKGKKTRPISPSRGSL